MRSSWIIAAFVVFAGGPARAAPQEVTLTEDESAVAAVRVTFGGPDEIRELLLRAPGRRKVKVGTITAGAGIGNPVGGYSTPVQFDVDDQGTAVKIRGKGEAVFFVYPPEGARASLEQVTSSPAADAPIEARALSGHAGFTLFLHAAGLGGPATLPGSQLTGALFMKLPAPFILYTKGAMTEKADGCALAAGEPVLVLNLRPGIAGILRANGAAVYCRVGMNGKGPKLESLWTPRRPAQVTLPEAAAPKHWFDNDSWLDRLSVEAFPEVGAYRARFAEYQACADKKRAQLDPDGRADRYDVVTYKGGKAVKVEAYSEKIHRQVRAACGWPKVDKQRLALKKKIAQGFSKAVAAQNAAISARLSALPE